MPDWSLEEQKKRFDFIKHMQTLKKQYKHQFRNGYVFEPHWETDKSKIDLSILPDKTSVNKDFNESYVIVWTELGNLFEHMASIFRNSYVKEKFWTYHDEVKIVRALEFWDNGYKMIPPVIKLNMDNTEIIPFDGKHRIAICHYFDISKIPIIIYKEDLSKFPKSFITRTFSD